MHGSYKFTEFTAQYIDRLRTRILGYSHEKFGEEILQSTQSTSYYLCTSTRRKHIHIDVLRKIFLIEYNAYLFVEKLEQMEELLEKAIECGDVLEKTIPIKNKLNRKVEEQITEFSSVAFLQKPVKTTLKSIYKTNNNLLTEFNEKRICVPSTVFTLGKCTIDPSFVNGKGRAKIEIDKIATTIFDEEKFEPSLRYVPIDYEILTTEERARVDKYIALRIQDIFGKIIDANYSQYPEQLLYSEYWLYGMFLMHYTAYITKDMQRYINKLYWNDENRTDWEGIFAQLRTNENIKNLYKYETENFVYFKDEDCLISKYDFPIFIYKYTSFDSEKKEDYVYHDDCLLVSSIDEHTGMRLIKLIHLFMAIYSYFLRNGESERAAFEHTGQKFVAYEVLSLPFNDPMLDLYPLPPTIMDVGNSNNLYDFLKLIDDFFENTELDEKIDADIIQLKRNHCLSEGMHTSVCFMKAISFDFECIRNISYAQAAELRDELQTTVNRFKIKNKL